MLSNSSFNKLEFGKYPTFLGEAIQSNHLSLSSSESYWFISMSLSQQQCFPHPHTKLHPSTFSFFVLPASECLGPMLDLPPSISPMIQDQSCPYWRLVMTFPPNTSRCILEKYLFLQKFYGLPCLVPTLFHLFSMLAWNFGKT